MAIQAFLYTWLLVIEGLQAYTQRDGMSLVIMQVVALAVAYVFPGKGSFIFFLCSVLVSMAKFYIVDVSRNR